MTRRFLLTIVLSFIVLSAWSAPEKSSRAGRAGRAKAAPEADAAQAGLQERLAAVLQAVQAHPQAGDALKAYARDYLIEMCTNEVVVRETRAQNERKATLDQIKAIDAEWSKAEDELPIHHEKMTNACAEVIRKFTRRAACVMEVFAMDNQGAVVGENILTGDYWQGDEAKFTKAYDDANGGVDVGKTKLDKSTNSVLQQISLPIIDRDGAVIGAITFGVAIDRL